MLAESSIPEAMNKQAFLAADDQEMPFFAPTNIDAIDLLIGQYREALSKILAVEAFIAGPEMRSAATYFFEGNRERFARYIPNVEDLFLAKKAIPALNSTFWSNALRLTDMMDYMPDKRRREWHEQIRKQQTPDFEEDTVRATLTQLLGMRMDFLSEMVDGIFRGLSGEHVTNRPEAFGKRMIIDSVCDSKSGLIHDLRSVIAKFMGRDQPYYGATSRALSDFRRAPGQWFSMDGGALRIRVYLKGTAHLEVHPSLAWRLNRVLAHLHPQAIPDCHRKPPARKIATKDFRLMLRPIPFAVLQVISRGDFYRPGHAFHKPNSLHLGYEYDKTDKHLKKEVGRVLESIGGVADGSSFLFDYDARDVIAEILSSGLIPDQKSHQFYPTSERLAREAVEWAEIGDEDTCCEPQAGQGGIADYLPKVRTICVEISRLHCSVLTAKGHTVINADFLEWAKTAAKVSRIVMNPPFSEGRALAHLEAAAWLLKPKGILVAILPASFRGKALLPGFALEWSNTYEDEFVGANVSVVILKAIRQ